MAETYPSNDGNVELQHPTQNGHENEMLPSNSNIHSNRHSNGNHNNNDNNNDNNIEMNGNNDDNEHEFHDDHNDHDDLSQIKAWKMHVFMDKKPICSFCIAIGMFAFCGLILAAVARAGNLLNFTSEVPMYMRKHPSKQAADAFIKAEEVASYDPQVAQSNEAIPQQSTEATVNMRLLYLLSPENGDDHPYGIFQKKYLDIIDEIEAKILDTTHKYEDYCRRIYTSPTDPTQHVCSRHRSITQFFDKEYFRGSVDNNYDVIPTLSNYINYLVPSLLLKPNVPVLNKNYSNANIEGIINYWAKYGAGTLPVNETFGKGIYNNEEMESIFWYIDPNGQTNRLANLFRGSTDTKFGETPLSLKGNGVLSAISFGLPLEGYTSATDDTEAQNDKIGEWCFNEFDKLFHDIAKEYKDDITFRWDCSSMSSYAVNVYLSQDLILMFGTFLTVFLFMTYMTGSFWLASWGMIMIFLNFLPSILLYVFISQQSYFGTLNMLGMFIILAIGADDIFVINDTWAQIRLQNERSQGNKATNAQRLTATIKHAGKVMATTSLSTIFSFLGNTTSLFPAVYTFGAFSAWLIFTNYCAVVLFYPCVLNLHDKYLYTSNLKRGWCICPCCPIAKRKYNIEDDRGCCYPIKSDINANDPNRKRPIDKFFEDTFFPQIRKYKCSVLIIFALVFVLFGYFATQLRPDPNLPQFLPNGNNYQEFSNDLADNFASENIYQITNNILWGIEGIDRTGTDNTVPDDIGNVIWANNFSFVQPNEQLHIAQICDDLLCGYKEYNCRYGIWEDLKIANPEGFDNQDLNIVKCFMTEFREWIQTSSLAQPNSTEIQSLLDTYGLSDAGVTIDAFDACSYDGTFPVEGPGICFAFIFRFIWMEENIPTTNPDYAEGVTNYDYWKSFINGIPSENPNPVFNEVTLSTDIRFIKVTVLMDMYVDTNYIEGQGIRDSWIEYTEAWRDNIDGIYSIDIMGNEFVNAPETLKSIMFTDRFAFPYFYLQERIIREAFVGIFVSLLLSFIVLICATGNYIMAFMSICAIACIVTCVIGFTVMNGWKLGVMEAVIFVMVVGMSVDYVVHLSEAYLHSGKFYRDQRSKRMLGIVGGSVLSGALSTIIGILWLLPATIDMFTKFGKTILFLIFISCLYALFAFTAATTAFGPQGTTGTVSLCLKRLCCRNKISKSNDLDETLQNGKSGTHIEMR